MSRRRFPSSELLWKRHVEAVLRVLCLALERLHAEKAIPVAETDLDIRLFLLARDVYRGLPATKRPLSFALAPKGEQLPATVQDVDQPWVRKKPDFKWRMHNNLAEAPEELTRDFDIESKRLGRPTSPTWVLTREYVVAGILRFLTPSHRYGNGVIDGAMIGYVQDWIPSEILSEVNDFLRSKGEQRISDVALTIADCRMGYVTRRRQELARAQVSPSRFVLHHLWVDLRGSFPV